jgi:hypothetical protein
MILNRHLKSLESVAIEREVHIAEMNAKLCELQTGLLARDESLAALQADIVQCDSALVGSRRILAEKIQHRHAEQRRFTGSAWWKAASPVRAPTFILSNIRRGRLKSRIRSLEALVKARDEQLERLNAHAATLADLATQKDRLLADLSAQASQRRLEIAALESGVQDESRACEAMLNELTNSKSWKLTAPARATASALAWWRQDIADRASMRRAKRLGSCRIEPMHQLTVNPDGSFSSTGIDPQFSVQHASGSIPQGWVEISFDVLETDAPLYPILYTDADTNFTQAVELPLGLAEIGRKRQILRIPSNTTKLRFDPTNREGDFAIGDLRLRKVSKRKALLELLRRSPHGKLKTLSDIRRQGLAAIWDEVFTYGTTSKHKQYSAWLQECDQLSDSDLRKIKEHAAQLDYKPLISIIMPTYNTKPEFLKAAIESIKAQN